MEATSKTDLARIFEELPDPQQAHLIRHPLASILAIAIMAAICGRESWQEIALWGRYQEEWLETFLDLPNRIPSHDTFGRLFSRLNPDAFERWFMRWMQGVVDSSQVCCISRKRRSGFSA
ncbi:MAG: ISAs1 family transposase [Phycisphaerae bacterium]